MSAPAEPSPEKEALKWATKYFRKRASDMTVEGSKSKSLEFALNTLLSAYDRDPPKKLESRAAAVIDSLKGSYLLPHFAAALLERGDSLPAPLKVFVISFLRDPSKWQLTKPGRKRRTLSMRNIHIGVAILSVCQQCSLLPTRNRAQKSACGASIVKQALADGAGLHLSEADVVKAWNYFRRGLSPGSIIHLGDVRVMGSNYLKRMMSSKEEQEYVLVGSQKGIYSSEELEPNE